MHYKSFHILCNVLFSNLYIFKYLLLKLKKNYYMKILQLGRMLAVFNMCKHVENINLLYTVEIYYVFRQITLKNA